MFTVKAMVGDLTWNDGIWSGDALLVERVRQFISEGRAVPTIGAGPMPRAADEPEWVAWFTARSALEDLVTDGEWSPSPDLPADLFDTPDGAVP